MMGVHIVDHPLIKYKITMLRDVKTGAKEFRELVSEITLLLLYEATRSIPLKEKEVETPIAVAEGFLIDGDILFVPVLRAGLAMVEGALKLIPNAKVAHFGVYRDHVSLRPVQYFAKFPSNISDMNIFVMDPMLATGGSLDYVVDYLKDIGGTNIKVLSIISAPEGADRLSKSHPEVDIYVAAMDQYLNDQGYIVPGLGDAGDRLYGTK